MRFFSILILSLLLFNFSISAQNNNKPIRLVIDAGHGGKDSGKPSECRTCKHEKDINLSIALQLGDYIIKNIPNVRIFYSRTSDVYLKLSERSNFANHLKADYLISIHCNSNPKPWVSGTKSHIHENKNNKSYQFAKTIQNEFKNNGRFNRGVMSTYDRNQSFYILRKANMPAVLVEVGFLSNEYEEHYLNSSYGQDNIAKSIYTAFYKYINPYQKNNSSIYKVQIMASNIPIPLDSTRFRNLNMKVEEYKGMGSYGYKYRVGNVHNKNEANKIAKEVKILGFSGAFVVKMR